MFYLKFIMVSLLIFGCFMSLYGFWFYYGDSESQLGCLIAFWLNFAVFGLITSEDKRKPIN